MSQIPAAGNQPTSDQPFGATSALNQLDLDSFLGLMMAELQNQDPLNPLENDQLLAQISQIREVAATDRLTETLESVLLGQNIASATNLIGADVVALTDDEQRVTGNVRRVTIDSGRPKLDLAVSPTANAAESSGNVEEGKYVYEVVWDGPEGQQFSFEMAADTGRMAEFNGAIQLKNLPETSGPKRIYRSSADGNGTRRLVGTLANASATSFVDAKAANERGEAISGTPQRVGVARRVTVSLNNVAQIEPPPQTAPPSS